MPGKHITLLDDDQWPAKGFDFELPIGRESVALGVIDVQRYCIDPESDLACVVKGQNPELFEDYSVRVQEMISNIQKLQSTFREATRKVFFTRHGAQTDDGSDLILRRRRREKVARESSDAGHMPRNGDLGYEVLDAVAPRDGELVFDKNTSSAFHSTPIDVFLRNMEIDTLVLAGVAADMCVLTTALDAADRGFHVIIASDACATFDAGSAEATQILFGRVFGYVMQTEEIIGWLKTGTVPSARRIEAK